MSTRLKERKKTVVQELSSQGKDDLHKAVRVTFSIPKKDSNDLGEFVDKLNKEGRSEIVTKSLVVRKALRLLYSQEDKFNQL